MMEDWYWDLNEIKNSPSSKVGIDNATETRYRTEGSKFISTLGQKLKLRYITLATGTVYFHRFYMYHSFKEYHRYAIASACLYLAGKVEETPKKARDLFKQIQENGLIAETAIPDVFGADPKEALMTLERILLKTIKFDLQVDHPYKFMLRYAKTFLGDRSKIEKVVQMGWTFINDSLCTTLCIQWEPEIIAIALTDLSCRISKYEISDWVGKAEGYKGKWWDQFVADVSMELLESICHQVLDFYSTAAPAQQPRPSSAASSSARSSESNKRTSSDSGSQLAAKVPRTDITSHQPPQISAPTSVAVSSQPISHQQAGVVAAAHAYAPPTGYPPQVVPQQTTVSTAPPHPGYPPPPGYPQGPPVYHAPPPPGQPPGSGYQPTGQPYYSQPPVAPHPPSGAPHPPAMPHQPPYYGSQPGRPAAPYPHVPQYPQQRRPNALKVIDVRPTLP